ncbi:hypothetical protein NN561_006833 [Cricetulus griseus]
MFSRPRESGRACLDALANRCLSRGPGGGLASRTRLGRWRPHLGHKAELGSEFTPLGRTVLERQSRLGGLCSGLWTPGQTGLPSALLGDPEGSGCPCPLPRCAGASSRAHCLRRGAAQTQKGSPAWAALLGFFQNATRQKVQRPVRGVAYGCLRRLLLFAAKALLSLVHKE